MREHSRGRSHDNMTIKAPDEIKQLVKKSYPQDWIAYNQAQTQEKILFMELLHELCSQIPKQKRKGRGRPPSDMRDMVFSCCLKIYLDSSSRRSRSDIKMAEELGYLDHTPHFNTVLEYLRKPELKIILTKLIQFSAKPLKELEENFAMDASGFSTVSTFSWNKCKRSHVDRRKFKKAHVMCGVKTNIITHIEVSDGSVHDTKMFNSLLRNTTENFDVREIYADKGYSSEKNLNFASKQGVIPFIPFIRSVKSVSDEKMLIWRVMFKYFKDHKEEFMRHYHRRSNVETVFAMMKRKFGCFVRAKSSIGRENEVLCKALCHNICVLIQETFELGIAVDFSDIEPLEFMCKIKE
jgi:transposase